MDSFLGTLYYVAPEVIKNKSYDFKCDMWSLGVCLYKMLTGSYPYSKDDIKNFDKIYQEKILTFP